MSRSTESPVTTEVLGEVEVRDVLPADHMTSKEPQQASGGRTGDKKVEITIDIQRG